MLAKQNQSGVLIVLCTSNKAVPQTTRFVNQRVCTTYILNPNKLTVVRGNILYFRIHLATVYTQTHNEMCVH